MRLAGWSGIVFVVLSGVIVVVSPWWPPLGASAAEVGAYYRDHRMPFLAGNYLAIVAAVPSFVQIGALVLLFKRAEGEGGLLWVAVLASAIFAHALGAIALVAYQVVPFELGAGQEAAAKAFNDFAGVAFACFLIGLSGFVGFTCWATWSTRALPGWFAWLGVPIAAGAAVGSLGAIRDQPRWLAGGGVVSANVTGLFFLWCLVLAVLFLRMPQNLRAASAA